jgi:hypothetical protein
MPKIPESEIAALKRGEWLQRQKGDMAVAVWKSQRVVRVLYNHCSPVERVSTERDGDAESVVCPRAVQDYFSQSRSVDVINQLHYGYLMGRKAKRCWPRLAWWLLDACILNAFRLWSLARERPDQLAFREELMHALLEQYHNERRAAAASSHPAPAMALAKDHYPERAAKISECEECRQRSERRVRSRFICHACGAHLCIEDCFGQHHQ